MGEEQPFRVLLILFFALFLPIGIYHRVKSEAPREKLDRRQEGLFILATLRPLGAAMWIGVIAWMINPGWMGWSRILLPETVRWIGVGVLVGAIALMIWTLRSLGPNLTDTVVTRRQHTLVTRGPYHWIRHPFYVCAALLVIGLSLITANWFLMLSGGIVLVLLVIRTRTEEANLVARFGDDYRRYMKRTGRFFPRMRATSI